MGTLDLENITPSVGSYVNNLDLMGNLSENQIHELRVALHDRVVLVFRDQEHLTPEGHVRFAARFGPIWMHPYAKNQHPDQPEILIFDENAPAKDSGWHVDGSFEKLPVYGALLHARELPSNGGGDTIWTSSVAAYEGLSTAMRRFLNRLTAVHAITMIHDVDGNEYYLPKDEIKAATHPVVMKDPLSGKRHLFIDPLYTKQITELSRPESRILLSYLFEHMVNPNLQVRVKWTPGMLVFWNNLLCQHFATNDYVGQRRLMFRVNLDGSIINRLKGFPRT